MSKTKTKAAGPRMLTCVVSGVQFEYKGRGRPPKYCPEVKVKLLADQQAKARAKQTAKRKPSKSERVAAAA